MLRVWVLLLVALVSFLILLGAAARLFWRTVNEEDKRLIKRIVKLPMKRQFRLASDLARDQRIPLGVRLIVPAVVLYLASPLDLIPDFIPVVGQLDDVLVMIVGARLLLRFAPREVVEAHVSVLEAAPVRRRFRASP